MGGVGVAEVERDVNDLAGRVTEHLLRDVAAGPCNHAREAQALAVQTTLQRPGAQPHDLGDGMHVRLAVGEQLGDDLAHDLADRVLLPRSLRRSLLYGV